MKIEKIACPQCGANLNIAEDREFFRCSFCNSQLKVDRTETGPTRLIRFEVLLNRVVSETSFLAAGKRLDILRPELARAGETVRNREAAAAAASQERQMTEETLRSASKKNREQTMGLIILAVGAWLWTIFSLGSEDTSIWLLVAFGLSIGAWYSRAQGKRLDREMPSKIQLAEEKLASEHADLVKAQSDLQDLQLEQELCQRTVSSFRMRAQ